MQLSKEDVLDYVSKRVRRIGTTPPFAELARIWQTAGEELTGGNPDKITKLLLEDLEREEASAKTPKDTRHESCIGPMHARWKHSDDARKIVALLWCIAEEHGYARVWGHQLTRREVQRAMHSDNPEQAMRNLVDERNEAR